MNLLILSLSNFYYVYSATIERYILFNPFVTFQKFIMKIKLSFAFALINIYMAIGQKKYQSGYYIGNDDIRVDGFIQIVDFEKLNYEDAVVNFKKFSEGKSEAINVSQIAEVAIGTDIKFRKYNVKIDDSDLYNVSTSNRYPEFASKTLFLNVIIEGAASLFVFDSGSGPKYFYEIVGKMQNPEQLMYKKYIFSTVAMPRENTEFRQQLFENVSCDGDVFNKFAKTGYNKDGLVPFFTLYNHCKNSPSTLYANEKKNKATLNFLVFAGGYNATAKIGQVDPKPKNANSTNFGFGGELELLTALEKWGLVARAEFENANFKSSTEREISSSIRTDIYEIDSKAFNFSIGPRYHFNHQSRHEILVDIFGGVNFPSGTVKRYGYINTPNVPGPGSTFSQGNYDAESGFFASLGFGYIFAGHYGIACRYEPAKKLIDSRNLSAQYSRFGVNVSYTF
jgi:hypothetical protein